MTPYIVNFKKVRRNVDFYHVFAFKSNSTTALNISAATFFLRVLPKTGAPTEVLDIALGTGLSFVTDGTDGKLKLLVEHTVMEAIPLGSYKYDLVMVRSTISEVIVEGSIKIVDGVTDI